MKPVRSISLLVVSFFVGVALAAASVDNAADAANAAYANKALAAPVAKPDAGHAAAAPGSQQDNDKPRSRGKRPNHIRPRPRPRPKGAKYFHEPGGNDKLGHYDARYFKGLVPYDEHRPALRHLIRSYLTTFRALGIETWLAHGTLLGWWWNGRIMPWDYDLDVQVSDVTLFYLGKHYNRTTHTYRYRDPITSETVVKEYLLDINPNHGLPRGDGLNIIDARWIDTSNGMFIDITGLAEREPTRRPGIWSCKNYHRYRTRELYPMRETEFEDVPAMIPYSFDKILTDEYGMKSLAKTEWLSHQWNPDRKEWIKSKNTKAGKFAKEMTDKHKPSQGLSIGTKDGGVKPGS